MELNIVQLYKDIVDRQKRRTVAFEKVLQSCHKLIKTSCKHDHMRCLFRVPDFVLGVPPYNIGECVKFLIERLEKGGFYLQYYYPNVLHISWDIADLERREDASQVKLAPLSIEAPKVPENMRLVDVKKRNDLSRSIVARPSRPVGKFTLTLE